MTAEQLVRRLHLNRCVGVHPSAITEALRKIYGLTALADELGK